MTQLLIFNPENDLALASGLEYYTAPPMAAQLHRDLQMLPAWWANNGDYILSQNITEDSAWAQHLRNVFGIDVNIIDGNHLQNHTFKYNLWGWNASTRNQLLALCVPACQLPDSESIAQWRKLSHRRETIRIHRRISQILGYSLCPEPREFTDLNAITAFANEHYRCFLKAPWSSSGKGIFRPTDTENLTYIYWVNGILQRQGSVIAEVAMDKTLDFAMEFHCEGGKASFIGYSIYTNNSHNSFDTGTVAPEETLRAILESNLGSNAHLLDDIMHALEQVLTEMVAGCYSGYLGIDMLIFRDESGKININPCVEMNLRNTMGVLTSIIGNRFIHHDSIGTYHCEYHKAPFNIAEYIEQKLKENPPLIDTSDDFPKIKSGTILLAPVYHDSRYCAYIDVAPR